MKRSRDDYSIFSVYWHTLDGGVVVGSWPRSFLKKYSQLFEGLFSSEESSDHVTIRHRISERSYSREVVQAVFRHLDGESLNLTNKEEEEVAKAIEFLKLKPPFHHIDTCPLCCEA